MGICNVQQPCRLWHVCPLKKREIAFAKSINKKKEIKSTTDCFKCHFQFNQFVLKDVRYCANFEGIDKYLTYACLLYCETQEYM